MTTGRPYPYPPPLRPRRPRAERRLVDDVKRALQDPKMTPEKLAQLSGRPIGWARAVLRARQRQETARAARPPRAGDPSTPGRPRNQEPPG